MALGVRRNQSDSTRPFRPRSRLSSICRLGSYRIDRRRTLMAPRSTTPVLTAAHRHFDPVLRSPRRQTWLDRHRAGQPLRDDRCIQRTKSGPAQDAIDVSSRVDGYTRKNFACGRNEDEMSKVRHRFAIAPVAKTFMDPWINIVGHAPHRGVAQGHLEDARMCTAKVVEQFKARSVWHRW